MAVSVQHSIQHSVQQSHNILQFPNLPPHTAQSVHEALEVILEDNHKIYNIHSQDHWPNALSGVLLSSYALGADASTLRSTFMRMACGDVDRSRFSFLRLTDQTWADYLGQRRYYRDFVHLFDQEIASIGLLPTFQKYFPTILPGLLGSSLRPLVQIGLGLTHLNPLVTSEGLAYAAVSYFSLPPDLIETSRRRHIGSSDSGGRRAAHVLDMVRADTRFQGSFEGSFMDKLRILMRSRADLLRGYVDEWGIEPNASPATIYRKLRDLSYTTATLFATAPSKRHNKLDYHLATLFASTRAVAAILPHIPSSENQIRLLKLQWLAVIATYVVQGRPAFVVNGIEPTVEVSWEDIVSKALASTDAIVPVLVRGFRETAFEEMNATKDEEAPEEEGVKVSGGAIFIEAARMVVSLEGGWDVKGVGWTK